METNKKNRANADNEEKNKNVTGLNSGIENTDDAIEDDGTPVLDEEDLDENDLDVEEAEDIEWEDTKDE
jgi:hypothetical protein